MLPLVETLPLYILFTLTEISVCLLGFIWLYEKTFVFSPILSRVCVRALINISSSITTLQV